MIELGALVVGAVGMTILLRWVHRSLDNWGNTGPNPLPEHGPTVRIYRGGRGSAIYVGRAGAFAWIQMPEHECRLTPDEAAAVGRALYQAAEEGRIYSVQQEKID